MISCVKGQVGCPVLKYFYFIYFRICIFYFLLMLGHRYICACIYRYMCVCIYMHVANIFIAAGCYLALGFKVAITEHSVLIKNI